MCVLAILFAPVSAQDSWNEAGVIIDYGDERITWIWVPFQGDASLIDVLSLSDLEMVTVGFGGMGEAVCQIDETGCPTTDCRTRLCQTSSSSPFWRLMKFSGDEWVMAGSGVSGTKVKDGDIFALSWSAVTPELPPVSMDEIASKAEADRGVTSPLPAMVTEGEAPEKSSASWIPATGVLVFVVAAAGFLVMRARSLRRTGS